MQIPFPFRDPASVWDLSRLGETPQVRRWPGGFGDDATPILLEGEPWRGRPTWCFAHYGVPDWATLGQRVLDAASPWLIENLTPSQRAYARELAIERRKA